MNIAERLTAGPPVLATVGRRAAKGDVVYVVREDEVEDLDTSIAEVVEAYPSIVGQGPNLLLRSLHERAEYYAYPREVVVLTKTEAQAVREHLTQEV